MYKRGEAMLDVEIEYKDIKISNVQEKDLVTIQKLMNKKDFLEGETNLEELRERFLESYISQCEFFLKIEKSSILIGILKGRIEFKNENELWIWYFYLSEVYKNTNLGGILIKEIVEYFSREYDVTEFFARTIKNEIENMNIWKRAGYKAIRIVKNFYDIDGKHMDMIIMKKI
jgi:GNAT superfamily N-acetyltransferase